MEALGHRRFAIVGFDTGMPIAYALAADHPERLERLVVGEAVVTGVTPSPPLLVPGPLNERLWHIAFNRLDGSFNEALVHGREDIFFGAEYAESAGTPLPDAVVKYYVERLASSRDTLRGSFGSYRAIDVSIAQNERRTTRKLTLPVLAIGGGKGLGEGAANTMRLVAEKVESKIIPGSGHWVAEEAPEQLLAALMPFLAPTAMLRRSEESRIGRSLMPMGFETLRVRTEGAVLFADISAPPMNLLGTEPVRALVVEAAGFRPKSVQVQI